MKNAPLTDAEFARLDDFMLREHDAPLGMCSSMLDGFLTAVVSGPRMILPAVWLRWVWDSEEGEAAPVFRNRREGDALLDLVMRHYNDIADLLMDAPEAYEPLLLEREHEGMMVSVIDEWCVGYEKGIALDREAWAPLMEEHPEWFRTIWLYGTEAGWKELEVNAGDLDEHEDMADDLAEDALCIHDYWLRQRVAREERGERPAVMGRQEPVRNPDKIGPNAPCPCGSGRKYKRCHGAH